ncbi:cytoskeletal protein RodZ [Rhodococcus sp. 27YEA15]
MSAPEQRRGLDRLVHFDWLPSRLFGGRLRTSTFLLVLAWMAAFSAHAYFNPVVVESTPEPAPATSTSQDRVPAAPTSTRAPVTPSSETSTSSVTITPESSAESPESDTPSSGATSTPGNGRSQVPADVTTTPSRPENDQNGPTSAATPTESEPTR